MNGSPTDGLCLTGLGSAGIDGVGRNSLTVAGADGVSLTGLEVHDGVNGIVGMNGAHVEERERARQHRIRDLAPAIVERDS